MLSPRTRKARTTAGHRPLPLPARVLVMLVAFALMVVFAAQLSRATLQPSAASEKLTHTSLRPGDSIREYLGQPALRDTVRQLGGNILLGVPFGILLPVLAQPTRGLLRATAATGLVVLLVELVQGTLVTGQLNRRAARLPPAGVAAGPRGASAPAPLVAPLVAPLDQAGRACDAADRRLTPPAGTGLQPTAIRGRERCARDGTACIVCP